MIHIDGKEESNTTYEWLMANAKERNNCAICVEGKEEHVQIVSNGRRVRVNWGRVQHV